MTSDMTCDVSGNGADKSTGNRLIGKQVAELRQAYRQFYPERPELEVAYAWAGTFGATKDGFAYIGASPELPNAYFALG